ncbi:PREDICTED: cyclin N-terminal domain-containing protein 1 [Cyprinodon variegatus]|uniref:cyclin N-terminal domain-containing protein 1 n=1 Tax=Cyprinodon variegatus TaxID=28743 RepID=UPI000742B508|nr:PREDICTED: cyclin N-terminal domain-containing protein 1 [Cyprinodon variegatus]
MAKSFISFQRKSRHQAASFKFRETSSDLLNDFLVDLNQVNKDNLDDLTKYSGSFKRKRFVEYVILMTEELKLDPVVVHHAVELLQRFMVKHIADMLATIPLEGATANEAPIYEVFVHLKDKLPLIIFSCVQLASKYLLHQPMIEASTAVQVLHSLGLRVSKQTLLESELMVFKGLEYRLNVLNPLTYVEVILEVLVHNEPSVPVEHLYPISHHVLLCITLDKAAIFESLLRFTTQCSSPSREQREKFVKVTEDRMLLGAGVIAAATYISCIRKMQQVVGELSHLTGISRRSIMDLSLVILGHITGTISEM